MTKGQDLNAAKPQHSHAPVTSRRPTGRRVLTTLLALILAGILAVGSTPASAISWDRDDKGVVKPATPGTCPTMPSTPAPFEVFLNTDDSESRGWWDPQNNEPWSFASRVAQVICGAKEGSQVRLGMYFIRLVGTVARPESDTEVIVSALEYVKKKRGVNVSLVLDDGLHKGATRTQITQRLKGIADVSYCVNGCFNVNKSSVYKYAINHEKFITVSDTTWANPKKGPHPVVLSTSGNFSRGQIRNYLQESTVVYDDYKLWKEFDLRFNGMKYCASPGCAKGGAPVKALQLKSERSIWVDPFYRRYTDSGRGTSVSFSPQTPSAPDYYISQFDGVDCAVDKRVRIAMFKMTDSKAQRMAETLARLKKSGCDVELLLSQSYGALVLADSVVKTLNAAKVPFKCSAIPMHTKMILIGPMTGTEGRVLSGTANMSTSGLRYSDEHVITMDTRRASPEFQEPMRRAYGTYLTGYYELSQGATKC